MISVVYLHRLSSVVGLTLALLATACGTSDPVATSGGQGGGGAQGGSGGTATGGGGAGGAEGCPSDGEMPPGSVCIEQVEGRLVDAQGAPVSEMLTTVCGTISCNPGVSAAEGDFSVAVNAFIPLSEFSINPHGRTQNKTVFYFPPPTETPGVVLPLGDLLLLDMPTGGPAVVAKQDNEGAPAQTLVSNGVTLQVDAGTHLELEFEDVLEGDARFEALAVPSEHFQTFAPGLNLVSLYAFYPFEAAFRPESDGAAFAKAELSFPNTTNLPPGTAVELLSHGSFVFPNVVKPASFAVVAMGRVSADGTLIETDAGEGVEVLTWVGIRPVN